MFSKVLSVAFLVVYVQAQGYKQQKGQATSYASHTQGTEQSSGISGDSYSPYIQRGSSGFNNYGPSYILDQGGLSSISSGFGGSSSYEKEPKAYPKYSFKYGVEDKHTGDIKEQEETRDGDTVKGYYALQEPDGTILVVRYTVEKKSGFNAVVERKGYAAHPQYASKN